MGMFARLSTRRRQCQFAVLTQVAICLALAGPSLLSGSDAPIAFEDKPPPETSAEGDPVQTAVADPLQADDIENCW